MANPDINYAKLLSIAYPGMGWALQDSNFDELYWDASNPVSKPTLEEALAKFDEHKSAEAMRLLRLKRNDLLKETDVYALPDYPHASDEARQAWIQYRKALRDVTMTVSPILTDAYELGDVAWPSKPTS